MLVCKNADNAPRWKQGERLDHLFEQRCDAAHAVPGGPVEAVITDDAVYTFRDLDNRANQVARFLLEQGIKSGDRVGLLFDKGYHTYVGLLAVLKVDAAYVPLDAGFPNDRIGFILQDAGVKAIVSMSPFRVKLADFPAAKIYLDEAAAAIDAKPTARLAANEKPAPASQLAYLIYTSGTTGTPKGVAIEHPSICNFVRVAAEVYGMKPGDRCYQGMTIAFDFSTEELWVPLIAGATLVPTKAGTSLVGADLHDFLAQRRVSVMCCVPTLLATIEKDLPDLRILLVSGEACPHNLVTRWYRPGRVILNAYGPTEATVTCTLTELYPDKPVTIGGPLPTYAIVILDPEKAEAIPDGGMGEIGIAGIGLAAGYLNRDDLTEKKFIPDFLNIPHNPSRRIYRSGDLGRINEQGEVEFNGRIDTQVKVRGYRIELAEIESVLMQLPQIAQAVVNTYEAEPGSVELAAYYSLKQGAADPTSSEIAALLRKHLPPYMVPAYMERLDVIPMTPSHKADRKALPAPKGPRFSAGSGTYVPPRNETEEILSAALMEVMKVERVSVTDNFFQDLGAHSLLMARFGSEIRKRMNVASISMRDIYLNPTIEKLAQYLAAASEEVAVQTTREPLRIPSNLEYYGCGALQLLFYVAYGSLVLWILTTGLIWTYAAIDDAAVLVLRSTAFAAAAAVGLTAIPVAAKWLLIGKWRAETFPIWSLRYFRFWLVKTLVQATPMAAFVGTPLYNVYLRLLGARIGRNVVIRSSFVPVCTDLLSIGDNTILRKDSILLGYKARSNHIHIGPVTIGSDAFVGEASVVDIDTVMGDRTQLGHSSSLQQGQRVPDGKHYHGSPAQETQADYCPIEPMNCTPLLRGVFSAGQLIGLWATATIPILILNDLYPYVVRYTNGFEQSFLAVGPAMLLLALGLSLMVMVAALGLGLVGIYAIPRLLNLLLNEDKTYVMYGFHYWVYRAIAVTSNSRIYNLLFGDSSYIIFYLNLIGWNLNTVVQTGSNFGTNQKHENPFLCEVGSGTMVSDGLSMINVQMSSTSFKLCKAKLGERNYLGNQIHLPPDSKVGANCLLGTKVMIPIDGPVRENVGLLGSPCFEIPRAVDRDRQFSTALDEEARQQRIRVKNAHNIVTVALFLLGNWLFISVMLLLGYAAVAYYPQFGLASVLGSSAFLSLTGILYFALLERASLGFKPLEPKVVSIYDNYFWFHERHWKFCESPLQTLWKGTPFKNVISRLLGVKVGRKVFDDGCQFLEKTLITIGDYANLNEAATLQGHSLEEGVFKSDYIRIGNGCTLGAGAFVHYGVTTGDNVVLDPDSFLMKGEMPDADTHWRGNPARAIGGVAVAAPALQPAKTEVRVAAAAAL